MSAPRGVIVWQGLSPITGDPIGAFLTVESTNEKTGYSGKGYSVEDNMMQLWIMRTDIPPVEAINTGEDRAICGDCPLRGLNGKERACYVVVAQGPTSVYRAFKNGSYPVADSIMLKALINGRKVRLGAYGDPTMVPFHVIKMLVDFASGHTGYTHQWPNVPAEWATILMASADSVADRRNARNKGWRSFYVVPKGTDITAIPNAVECMATREKNPRKCIECLACAGTRGKKSVAVDIAIEAHGNGAKYI
jgi:hypothetical protein